MNHIHEQPSTVLSAVAATRQYIEHASVHFSESAPGPNLRNWHCFLQDTVNFPVHLKNFNMGQLRQLCKELRSDIVHTVSKTGGAQTKPWS